MSSKRIAIAGIFLLIVVGLVCAHRDISSPLVGTVQDERPADQDPDRQASTIDLSLARDTVQGSGASRGGDGPISLIAPVNGRVIRGRCVDTQGSTLRRGRVSFDRAMGGKRVTAEIELRGDEFEILLPETIASAGHALVAVSTSSGILFAGLIRLDDYVTIPVLAEGDWRFRVAGRVTVDGPAPERWNVAVYPKNQPYIMAGSFAEQGYSGSSAEVVLNLFEPRHLESAMSVSCVLTDISSGKPVGSSIGRIEFPSYEDFCEKFTKGITFATYMHSIVAKGPLAEDAELVEMTVRKLNAEHSIPRTVPILHGIGKSILTYPGKYGVVARTARGSLVAGDFEVGVHDCGSTSVVSWRIDGAGLESATAIIVDESGAVVPQAMCWWRREDLPAGHDYEIWGKPDSDVNGTLKVSKLRPGRYVLFAQSQNGDQQEEVVCDVPNSSPTRVVLRSRGRINVDLRQSLAYADSLGVQQMWIAKEQGAWRERMPVAPHFLPVFRGVMPGVYRIAVVAGDLVGSAVVGLPHGTPEVDVAVDLAVSMVVAGSVVVKPLVPSSLEVVVHKPGTLLPWERSLVGPDGSFSLRIAALGEELALRTASGNTIVRTWRVDSYERQVITLTESEISALGKVR